MSEKRKLNRKALAELFCDHVRTEYAHKGKWVHARCAKCKEWKHLVNCEAQGCPLQA